MCPLGYSEGAAGLAAGLLIMGGLIGSFVVGPLARRFNKQIDSTKVAMPLASMCGVFLVMSLRYADFYPAIVLSLMGFGFCGLGSFPIVLELAVEVGRKCIFIKNRPTTIIQCLDIIKIFNLNIHL